MPDTRSPDRAEGDRGDEDRAVGGDELRDEDTATAALGVPRLVATPTPTPKLRRLVPVWPVPGSGIGVIGLRRAHSLGYGNERHRQGAQLAQGVGLQCVPTATAPMTPPKYASTTSVAAGMCHVPARAWVKAKHASGTSVAPSKIRAGTKFGFCVLTKVCSIAK